MKIVDLLARSAADYILVHPGNEVVDEVLSVAMVATLNVMQPLLVHTTLYTADTCQDYNHR